MNNLYVLRGLPGSGKTTVAKTLAAALPNAIAVAADDFFTDQDGTYRFDLGKLKDAHAWCQSVVDLYMEEGMSNVIVHNTSTTEKELQPYLDMAKRHGYVVTSLVVENRHGNQNIHSVPQETLEKMATRFTTKLI